MAFGTRLKLMENEMRLQFAKRLRALRKKKGWSQEELADRADMSWRQIQRLERLKNPPAVKIDAIYKLSKAFKIKTSKLLD